MQNGSIFHKQPRTFETDYIFYFLNMMQKSNKRYK